MCDSQKNEQRFNSTNLLVGPITALTNKLNEIKWHIVPSETIGPTFWQILWNISHRNGGATCRQPRREREVVGWSRRKVLQTKTKQKKQNQHWFYSSQHVCNANLLYVYVCNTKFAVRKKLDAEWGYEEYEVFQLLNNKGERSKRTHRNPKMLSDILHTITGRGYSLQQLKEWANDAC